MFMKLSKEKTQILLSEGVYHGVNHTPEAISAANWNCEVPIKMGHDEFLQPAEIIGSAKVKTENSIVTFTYEFFDEIQLGEYAGWSAHYKYSRDGLGNAVIKELKNIALLKDMPPAVPEAEIKLRGDNIEKVAEEILNELKELKEKQEEMRLQLTELKKSNTEEAETTAPTPEKDLGTEMKNALGEESSITEITGVLLDTGWFK